jgi:phosphate transport system substrate-binding protein
VDGGNGCVAPTTETVQDGSYTPLSRPLFIYVKNESLQKPEVKAFVQYLLDNEQTIAENALFVPLTDEQLQESQATFEAATS